MRKFIDVINSDDEKIMFVILIDRNILLRR